MTQDAGNMQGQVAANVLQQQGAAIGGAVGELATRAPTMREEAEYVCETLLRVMMRTERWLGVLEANRALQHVLRLVDQDDSRARLAKEANERAFMQQQIASQQLQGRGAVTGRI